MKTAVLSLWILAPKFHLIGGT